MPVLIQRYIKW